MDQNSHALVDLAPVSGNAGGMQNWFVDNVNQLQQQWFWFRIGSAGPELPISAIGGLTFSTPDARTLYTTYNNGAYSVTVNYLLTGSTPGSGNSDIAESISILNSTAAPLDFHFYQYSHFQLGGIAGGETITLGKNLRGLFNEATIAAGPNALSETVVTPGANHGEATNYPVTLTKLSDANPDTLSDSTPFGPGDGTWAFEWDLTIAPGSSASISKDKALHWEQVPEPTALALLVAGGAGMALLRRNRRNA